MRLVILFLCVLHLQFLAAQTFEWAAKGGTELYDEAFALSIDSEGNSYITGALQDLSTKIDSIVVQNSTLNDNNEYIYTDSLVIDTINSVSTALFTAKFHSDGSVAWVEKIGGIGNDVGQAITLDDTGNVYTAGTFSDDISLIGISELSSSHLYDNDATILAYNNLGQLQWATQINGTGDVSIVDLAKGIDDHLFIGGNFQDTLLFGNSAMISTAENDFFLAKYSLNGDLVWQKQFGSTNTEGLNSLSVDNEGNILIGGYFSHALVLDSQILTSDDTNDLDAFIAKLDSDGNVLWASAIGGDNNQLVNSIASDNSGNIYLAGALTNTLNWADSTYLSHGGTDIFTAKYSSTGEALWLQTAGGSNTDWAYNIAVDNDGRSYLIGTFDRNFTVNDNTTSTLSNDILTLCYNTDGTFAWMQQAGSGEYDAGYDIAVDAVGYTYITGGFRSTCTFDTHTITSSGGADLFIAKLAPAAFVAIETPLVYMPNFSLNAYPNPVQEVLYLTLNSSTFSNNIADLQISNMGGQIVLRQPISLSNNTESLDLSSLPQGIYLLQIQSGALVQTQKIIKQ